MAFATATSSAFRQPSVGVPSRRSAAGVKTKLRAVGDDEQLVELWRGRRKAARMLHYLKLETTATQEEILEEEEERDAAKSVVATTAFSIALVAILIRLGGRAMLLGMIGLDPAENEAVAAQVDSVISLQSLPFFIPGYLMLWVVGKCLFLDPLVFLLAVSSGVIFGGVVEGALVSAACATIASSVAFGLARGSDARPKILRLARRNARLRALEQAVSARGFATVLVLRLAPVLPIPLGSYPYIYGATEMEFLKFAPATFLGSLKPYAFDSYLGVVGKDALSSTAGSAPEQSDLSIILVFGAFLFVGSLASQLATQTWEDIERANKQEGDWVDPTDNLDEDWADVLGVRQTFPWQVSASVSNGVKEKFDKNEPEWSRSLRRRADRAKFALAHMVQQEVEVAAEMYQNDSEIAEKLAALGDGDKWKQERRMKEDEEEYPITEKLPPGADAYADYPGALLEAIILPYVVGRSLWKNETIAEEIAAYEEKYMNA